jgi:hypothetical protein
MIDKNLPEPEEKRCTDCGRTNGKMVGTLIHWPSDDYEKKWVETVSGHLVQSFSFWAYKCQWCRATETRKKNRTRTFEGGGEE